jgi:hypothetical protein
MLMRSHDRAFGGVLFPIGVPICIPLLLQGSQDALPAPGLLPSIKAAGDRPNRAISLWHITPGRPGSQDPQDPIEDASMIMCWAPNGRFLWGKQGAQLLPLLICQFFSSPTSDYRLRLRLCRYALDLKTIGKTPSCLPSKDEEQWLTRAEVLHILYASLLGEPFNWSTQQNGRILNEILPLKENVGKVISTGSDQLFDLHTEDAFHPYMAGYLGFLCIRNPDRVPTVISQLKGNELDDTVKSILFEPRFLVKANASHTVKQVETRSPVLFGHPDSPYLRINLNMRESLEHDHEAREAFNILVMALEKNATDLILEPGDYCHLDNFRVVHGRRPFNPTYDGNDRWLKRILITNDLRKSRALRHATSSRIIRPASAL